MMYLPLYNSNMNTSLSVIALIHAISIEIARNGSIQMKQSKL